jgi:hypothetical protein
MDVMRVRGGIKQLWPSKWMSVRVSPGFIGIPINHWSGVLE